MTDPVAAGTALIDRCHRELVAPLLPLTTEEKAMLRKMYPADWHPH